jgi:hypothetical protein
MLNICDMKMIHSSFNNFPVSILFFLKIAE